MLENKLLCKQTYSHLPGSREDSKLLKVKSCTSEASQPLMSLNTESVINDPIRERS